VIEVDGVLGCFFDRLVQSLYYLHEQHAWLHSRKKMHGFSKQFTIIFNSTIEKFILHGSTEMPCYLYLYSVAQHRNVVLFVSVFRGGGSTWGMIN
jgi:hypothetical protein